eukprot:SAG31_NODE_151_length_22216_cov_37.572139_2_plen_368_part_00
MRKFLVATEGEICGKQTPLAAPIAMASDCSSRMAKCPLCGRHFHQQLVQTHAADCAGQSNFESPASAPVVTEDVQKDAARQPRSLRRPIVERSVNEPRQGSTRGTSPPASSAPTSVVATVMAPTQLANWGSLMDSERCQLLQDPSAAVRRSTRQWLECQRPDAWAFSRHYCNVFQDRRPPGSASDNLRDAPHTVMRRISPVGQQDRRTASEIVALRRSNLLLICREALGPTGQASLCSQTIVVAKAVLDASEPAQQLLAQLLYNRGMWHRLSFVAQRLFSQNSTARDDDEPVCSSQDKPQQEALESLQLALRELVAAGLARDQIFDVDAAEQPALLWLLKTEEIRGLGRAAVQKKRKLDGVELVLNS